MNPAHAAHRFEQAHAAMRRAQSLRAGESLADFAARMLSPENKATALRHARRMESIYRRCSRIISGGGK